MKFIVRKLGLQKLKTYESTFFPDRKTPAAIKIQNLEAAVFYSIFSHRQFNRSYTAILALLAIAVEAVIILLFNTKGKIFFDDLLLFRSRKPKCVLASGQNPKK